MVKVVVDEIPTQVVRKDKYIILAWTNCELLYMCTETMKSFQFLFAGNQLLLTDQCKFNQRTLNTLSTRRSNVSN